MTKNITIRYPVEYDNTYVYLWGRLHKIIDRKITKTIPIVRSGKIIGKQTGKGYLHFIYKNRKYRGYFMVSESGKHGIYKVRLLPKKRKKR